MIRFPWPLPAPRVGLLATAAGLLLLMPAVPARAGGWGKCPASVKELVDKADRVTRGNSSKGTISMKVYKRGTMSMQMRVWSKGRDKFLAKIRRPTRLKGMATLKSGQNLWNYLPKLDRIVKLGTSMMGNSWMGSHITNDDLVKETDLRKHYTCTAHRAEGDHMIVTLAPKPTAPVVWGKLIMKIRKTGTIPVWTEYYNERGKLTRTMRFENIRNMSGRIVPTRMVLQPADAPSERTVLNFDKIQFDVPIPNRLFTLQGLKG